MTDQFSSRFATLLTVKTDILPNYLAPQDVPTDETLRSWFDTAKIPRIKTNPAAVRGGGTVYYSAPAIEKYLRSRLLPGRVPPLQTAAAKEGQNEVTT
jgi:hypothetical protein